MNCFVYIISQNISSCNTLCANWIVFFPIPQLYTIIKYIKRTENMDLISIGSRIKAERKKLGLSQERLAEQVNVTPHYIYEI